jgi:predicted glutamine amidotransferase
MCIIVVKPRNKEIQDKKTLERCFTINRDGAGYMYVDEEKKVVIKKGFMKFDDFHKSVMKDYKENNLKNQNLIMHFRIGTSGRNKLGCTHPFPITDKMDDLELTKCKTNIGICHNGIVSGFNSYANQYSDTELYIATVITPLIRLNLQSYKFKDVQELILKTTNSKWAVLDRNDNYYLIGNFIEDNGYYYSNETYKPYLSLLAHDDDDDEDDLEKQSAWYHKAYEKQENYKNSMKQLPDVKTYKVLQIGNVVSASSSTARYAKQLKWYEVDVENEYYFDKDYNVYRKFKDGPNTFIKVGEKALIYTNESLVQRRGFYDI